MTVNSIADSLKNVNLIKNKHSFRIATRILGASKKIQQGLYYIPGKINNYQLIKMLCAPGLQTIKVTIPEGLNVKQIAAIFRDRMKLDSASFVNICFDSATIGDFHINAKSLEGYLYPDTYNFNRNSSCREVISILTNQSLSNFDMEIDAKAEKLNLSRHEVLTLASIIQGEVMNWDEAGKISAVYHNRLKKRMRLGADPTIQYILPGEPRRLLNKDLTIDSPYNTYRFYGLPPGPINNPGLRAIQAAVSPEEVDYLYFVAKGDGNHYFNTNHKAHNRDKEKLQKIRREYNHSKNK